MSTKIIPKNIIEKFIIDGLDPSKGLILPVEEGGFGPTIEVMESKKIDARQQAINEYIERQKQGASIQTEDVFSEISQNSKKAYSARNSEHKEKVKAEIKRKKEQLERTQKEREAREKYTTPSYEEIVQLDWSEKAKEKGITNLPSDTLTNSPYDVKICEPCLQCETASDCCSINAKFECEHGESFELPVLQNENNNIFLVAHNKRNTDFGWEICDKVKLSLTSDYAGGCGGQFPYVEIVKESGFYNYIMDSRYTDGAELDFVAPSKDIGNKLQLWCNLLFLSDISEDACNHYLVTTRCRALTKNHRTHVYVYPKIKWAGSISFGFDIEQKKLSKDEKKKVNKKTGGGKIRRKDRISELASSSFEISGNLTLYYGNESYEITSPSYIQTYIRNAKKYKGYARKGTELLSTAEEFKTKLNKYGKKLKVKGNWLESINLIGPNFSISGGEEITEGIYQKQLLSESFIEFGFNIGLEGVVDMEPVIHALLQKASRSIPYVGPAVSIGLKGVERGLDKLEEGVDVYWYQVTLNTNLKLIISAKLGERTTATNDSDAICTIGRNPGEDWKFTQGTLALEYSLRIEGSLSLKVAIRFEGTYSASFGAGGEAIFGIQGVVDNSAKVVKANFYHNGIKVYYYKEGEKDSSEDSNAGKSKRKSVKIFNKGIKETSSKVSAGTGEEIILVEPGNAEVELFQI